jgi:NADH-quinone oxidoreductase subunit L
MRLMGGLRKRMPFTFACYLLSGLSLAGLPFFSGFLSKDAILLGALQWADAKHNFIWFIIPDIGFITAFLTALYIGRQLILVFFGKFRLPVYVPKAENTWHHISEVPFSMKLPMGLLAILSVFIFFSFNPFDAAHGWFLSNMQQNYTVNTSWHTFTLITSALLACTGLVLAYFSTNNRRVSKPVILRKLSLNNWYLETIYRQLFVGAGTLFMRVSQWIDTKLIDRIIDYTGISTVVLAHITAWIDRTFVDGAVNLTAYTAGRIGLVTKSIQGGKVQNYFLYAIFGLIVLIVWIIL